MKVLFYTVVDPNVYQNPSLGTDYLIDTTCHGLRKLLGEDFVDYPRVDMIYKDYPKEIKTFSLYKLLDNTEIDRDDIWGKIENKYFDYVFVSTHHTMHYQPRATEFTLNLILEHYPAERVGYLCGWDRTDINWDIVGKCRYFKRELVYDDPRLDGIQFGIPEENFHWSSNKTTPFFSNICANNDWNSPHSATYTYKTQEEYYFGLRSSYFAYNCKKGGYDCARIGEVVSQGTLIVWTDWENKPPRTLSRWNLKDELIKQIKRIPGVDYGYIDPNKVADTRNIRVGGGSIDFDKFDHLMYDELRLELFNFAKKALTTQVVAKGLLYKMESPMAQRRFRGEYGGLEVW